MSGAPPVMASLRGKPLPSSSVNSFVTKTRASTAAAVGLLLTSVVLFAALYQLWIAPMTASPSCPTSPLDHRLVAVGAALLLAGAGVAIGALQLRHKMAAAALAITVLSTVVCLVYAFLLVVLTFCAVPATN
jgi:hypothetical protein